MFDRLRKTKMGAETEGVELYADEGGDEFDAESPPPAPPLDDRRAPVDLRVDSEEDPPGGGGWR